MTKEHSRPREVERFIVDLKNICVENGLICFLGVQLGRRTDYETGEPKLADLADSSAIEKEADAVVFMWIDKAMQPESEGDKPAPHKIVNCSFGKNRHGLQVSWKMIFNRNSMRMFQEETNVPKNLF